MLLFIIPSVPSTSLPNSFCRPYNPLVQAPPECNPPPAAWGDVCRTIHLSNGEEEEACCCPRTLTLNRNSLANVSNAGFFCPRGKGTLWKAVVGEALCLLPGPEAPVRRTPEPPPSPPLAPPPPSVPPLPGAPPLRHSCSMDDLLHDSIEKILVRNGLTPISDFLVRREA